MEESFKAPGVLMGLLKARGVDNLYAHDQRGVIGVNVLTAPLTYGMDSVVHGSKF